MGARKQHNYNLYATALNAYGDYLHSDEIYSEYWGSSHEPPFSEEEFRELKRIALIDRLNRKAIPWEQTEKMDLGTAFNILIDSLLSGVKDKRIELNEIGEPFYTVDVIDEPFYTVEYNNRHFNFPQYVCKEFYNYFKGALSQVRTEATLPTKYGDVLLYGDVDELLPTSVHDIKTTGRYKAGKFKNGWQHVVYPYCLNQNGNNITDFEYNILVIDGKKSGDSYETYTEYYNYVPETDVPRLTAHVEGLIDFIQAHRNVIFDKKLFNQHEVI